MLLHAAMFTYVNHTTPVDFYVYVYNCHIYAHAANVSLSVWLSLFSRILSVTIHSSLLVHADMAGIKGADMVRRILTLGMCIPGIDSVEYNHITQLCKHVYIYIYIYTYNVTCNELYIYIVIQV